MRINCLFVLIMFVFGCFLSGDLRADLKFSNRSSAIAIKSSNSALKLGNVSKVSGWTQASIVKDFGHNSPSLWVENYANGAVIAEVGGTDIPTTNLTDNNSNAIAYWTPINNGTSNAVTYWSPINMTTSEAVNYQAGWNTVQDALIRTNSNATGFGIKNNSDAIVYWTPINYATSEAVNYQAGWNTVQDVLIRTDSNAFAYGIQNNSNAIIRLSNASPSGLVVQNSNAIAYWTPINYATSEAVNYQAGWNTVQDALIRTDSNAFAYGIKNNSNAIIKLNSMASGLSLNNSNAIIFLNDLVRTDSNAFAYGIKNNSNAIIKLNSMASGLSLNNSNAIIFLNDVVRTDSNAFAYGIKNNSNTVVYLNDKMNTSTISLPAIILRINNNSSAIVWLDNQMQTIDHGPNNIQINTPTHLMTFDYYLSNDHMLDIQNSCEIDGGGHFMHFAQDNSNVLVIAAASNVVLKNVVLKNFNDASVQLGAGSTLTFGDGTTIELENQQTLSKPWIFDGSATINGFGSLLDLGTQNIQIQQQGSLILQDLTLNSLYGNNLRCVGDASITFRNDILVTTTQGVIPEYTFTCGSLIFDQDVKLKGVFVYQSDKVSTINKNSRVTLEPLYPLFPLSAFVYDTQTSVNRDLIAMEDFTSEFYVNGCMLASSTTGMRLTKGTVTFDGKCYLWNPGATSLSEGICFGNGISADDLYVNVLPGASMDIVGILDIQNVN